MSFSDLASLGSFVSGVAVVVSFAFLGFQIRQANRNQRSQIQQGRAGAGLDLMLRLTEPHLQESMMRGRAGDMSLEPAQIDAFVRAWIATFSIWEDSFLQRKTGTIDSASLASGRRQSPRIPFLPRLPGGLAGREGPVHGRFQGLPGRRGP